MDIFRKAQTALSEALFMAKYWGRDDLDVCQKFTYAVERLDTNSIFFLFTPKLLETIPRSWKKYLYETLLQRGDLETLTSQGIGTELWEILEKEFSSANLVTDGR